jgi:hypothetical protein
MAVEVQGAASGEIERREGVLVVIVAATDDRALAAFRHDEGERRFGHFAVMDGNAVFRGHVDEHAAEPVVGDGGEQIGRDAELGTAERGGHCIAAEGDGVVARHRLLVTRRQGVRHERDVDVTLTDEQSFHALPAIPQSGGNPVDGEMDALDNPFVGVAGAIALEQFQLHVVERIDVGEPVADYTRERGIALQ